jgi:G3E family GTPase
MAQVPFFLITGWLGAGKTTLLKNILNRHAGGRKIAVVQNEFAPSGVDGVELRRTGRPFRMLELNRGSVFCICLFSDFRRSLSALIDEYAPDAVAVEATGLADPIALAQLLETPELKKRVYLQQVWCVVDLAAYSGFARGIRQVEHQIRVADTVLLNKCDLAAPAEIERVKKEISVLNPFARVEPVSFAGINLDDIFEKRPALPAAGRIGAREPEPRPPVETAVLRHAGTTTRKALQIFIDKYAPRVWRLKGFVRCREGNVSVQLSHGTFRIAAAAGYDGPTEITAVGGGFAAGTMRADFAEIICK